MRRITGDPMKGDHLRPMDRNINLEQFKDYPTLDELFVNLAFSLLSCYGYGIHRKKHLSIRPKQVRLILSNIRISKPIIEKILERMTDRGLVKRNNQYIVIKKCGGNPR